MSGGSYSNDVASPEVEIAGEATGGFFSADAKNRHADLKVMLDNSKDSMKLEAMKRIITMVAKGKDASELFPAVVKNVAAKNIEVKKLVYVYLVRYAEEQQDLALLSISTFQRALKDPNQLIRASALRVLSSIRVSMIVPIMMLAIKESVRDMSPYVRKTAAHAIPKLYVLDPEQKDQLIEVINHLLADRTTLVAGSAVYAFEEVCPERFDLIHKHYRKLCQLLVDVEEWGQITIINMLTRYARTQFTDPNTGEDNDEGPTKFYSSEEEENEESDDEKRKSSPIAASKPIDPDLVMLLKNTKPLLQSRNAAVVLAVAQLYYHLAPKNEVGIIARALIRLLRSHREVQSIVLTNIATISAKRRVQYVISKNMFEPFLKSFFVRSSDPTHIKLLKLEILTNLGSQANINIILREFQTYVVTHDKEFAAATIDAIGRCASNIKEVTDVCLSGLVNLMANRNETVVAQSVVVIKKLLQKQPSQHKDIIISMARLIDSISVPAARASILWLIGEYCERVPNIAPDVLRKMAKSFVNEEEAVKLQILNLAVKLYLTNREQTELLVQYLFTLARYDQSYDLRDRARFLKNLVMPQKPTRLSEKAKSIFLTPKPAPVIESRFKDRDQYQLGTLSHYLNQRCAGYHEIPDFPESAPDPTVRHVAEPIVTPQPSSGKRSLLSPATSSFDDGRATADRTDAGKLAQPTKLKRLKPEKFYSDEESEEEEEEVEDEDEEGEESSEEEEEVEENEGEEEEEEEESEEDEDEDESAEEEEPDVPVKKPSAPVKEKKTTPKETAKPSKATDLLLDFDDIPGDMPAGALMAPQIHQSFTTLMPSAASERRPSVNSMNEMDAGPVTAPAQYVPTVTKELINRLTGKGVSLAYRFTRGPNIYSSRMLSVELTFTNAGDKAIGAIRMRERKIGVGMELSEMPVVDDLGPGQTRLVVMGIDYGDSSQVAELEVVIEDNKHLVAIGAPFGEQIQPLVMSEMRFLADQAKLSGMNESSGNVVLLPEIPAADRLIVCQRIYKVANVINVADIKSRICFAGETLSGKYPVLISLQPKDHSNEVKLTINCEKMVVGSMLFKEIKAAVGR